MSLDSFSLFPPLPVVCIPSCSSPLSFCEHYITIGTLLQEHGKGVPLWASPFAFRVSNNVQNCPYFAPILCRPVQAASSLLWPRFLQYCCIVFALFLHRFLVWFWSTFAQGFFVPYVPKIPLYFLRSQRKKSPFSCDALYSLLRLVSLPLGMLHRPQGFTALSATLRVLSAR
jgi:hypothetical protein